MLFVVYTDDRTHHVCSMNVVADAHVAHFMRCHVRWSLSCDLQQYSFKPRSFR